MDGTTHGGPVDGAAAPAGADADTAPQPILTSEAAAAHHHERLAHAHAAPGGHAAHEAPHHAAAEAPLAVPQPAPRRRPVVVGAALAALLVLVGGVAAWAVAQGRPVPAASPSTSATPTAPAAAGPATSAAAAPGVEASAAMLGPSQPTLVLGDSLGLTVYPWLADLLPDRYVSYEAEVGRTTAGTLQALRALPSIPPVVVVSSGTNDITADGLERDAAAILDMLGPQRCVVWVDVVRPDRGYASAESLNAAIGTAAQGRSNVSVLRWTDLVEANPSWIGGDGIHPGLDGAEGRAQAFAAASLACSPLDPDAPRAQRQYLPSSAFYGPIAGGGSAPATTSAPAATRTDSPSPSRTASTSGSGSPSASPSASPSGSATTSEPTPSQSTTSESSPPPQSSGPPPSDPPSATST